MRKTTARATAVDTPPEKPIDPVDLLPPSHRWVFACPRPEEAPNLEMLPDELFVKTVFGYQTAGIQNSLRYTEEHNIVFTSGSLGIVQNGENGVLGPESSSKQFFNLTHPDPICCLTLTSHVVDLSPAERQTLKTIHQTKYNEEKRLSRLAHAPEPAEPLMEFPEVKSTLIATGEDSRESDRKPCVVLWSAETGATVLTIFSDDERSPFLAGHRITDAIQSLAFSPNGSILTILGADLQHTVVCLRSQTGWSSYEFLGSARTTKSPVNFATWLNGFEFALGGEGHFSFWNQACVCRKGSFGKLPSATLTCGTAFQGALVAGTQQGTLLRAQNDVVRGTADLGQSPIVGIECLQKGEFLLALDSDGLLGIWSSQLACLTKFTLSVIMEHLVLKGKGRMLFGKTAVSLCGHPDDLSFLIGFSGGEKVEVTLDSYLELESVEVIGHSYGPNEIYQACPGASDTSLFYTVGSDSLLREWDLKTGAMTRVEELSGVSHCVATSPDGYSVAIGIQKSLEDSAVSSGYGFQVLLTFDFNYLADFPAVFDSDPQHIRYTPNGAALAFGCANGSIYIVRTCDYTILRELHNLNHPIDSLDFSSPVFTDSDEDSKYNCLLRVGYKSEDLVDESGHPIVPEVPAAPIVGEEGPAPEETGTSAGVVENPVPEEEAEEGEEAGDLTTSAGDYAGEGEGEGDGSIAYGTPLESTPPPASDPASPPDLSSLPPPTSVADPANPTDPNATAVPTAPATDAAAPATSPPSASAARTPAPSTHATPVSSAYASRRPSTPQDPIVRQTLRIAGLAPLRPQSTVAPPSPTSSAASSRGASVSSSVTNRTSRLSSALASISHKEGSAYPNEQKTASAPDACAGSRICKQDVKKKKEREEKLNTTREKYYDLNLRSKVSSFEINRETIAEKREKEKEQRQQREKNAQEFEKRRTKLSGKSSKRKEEAIAQAAPKRQQKTLACHILVVDISSGETFSEDYAADWCTFSSVVGLPTMGIWIQEADNPEIPIRFCSMSLDRKLLATVHKAGEIRLYSYPVTSPFQPYRLGRIHDGEVSGIEFLDSTHFLTYGATDHVMALWEYGPYETPKSPEHKVRKDIQDFRSTRLHQFDQYRKSKAISRFSRELISEEELFMMKDDHNYDQIRRAWVEAKREQLRATTVVSSATITTSKVPPAEPKVASALIMKNLPKAPKMALPLDRWGRMMESPADRKWHKEYFDQFIYKPMQMAEFERLTKLKRESTMVRSSTGRDSGSIPSRGASVGPRSGSSVYGVDTPSPGPQGAADPVTALDYSGADYEEAEESIEERSGAPEFEEATEEDAGMDEEV